MKSKWQIRKANPGDSGDLENCMKAAYAGYQERMGGVRLPPMDVDYLSEIENYSVWVVESEGQILGGLIIMFERDQASVANIAVDPRFQGQGIGGALIGLAESIARGKGYSEMRLATHVLLEENISFYQYLGWKETGRDETRVFMKKEI